jgi:hypothetical protein
MIENLKLSIDNHKRYRDDWIQLPIDSFNREERNENVRRYSSIVYVLTDLLTMYELELKKELSE